MNSTRAVIIFVFLASLILLSVSLSVMVSNACYQADNHDWFEVKDAPYGIEYLSERIMQCKYNEAYSWILYVSIVGVTFQATQLGFYIFEIQTHICFMKEGECRRSPTDNSIDGFLKVVTVICAVLMVIGAAMLGLYDANARHGKQSYGREHGIGVAILVTGYIILHVITLLYRARVWMQEEKNNAGMSTTGVASSLLLNMILLTISAVFLMFFFLESFNFAILSENALIAFALCLQGINLYWLWTIEDETPAAFAFSALRLGTRQPTASTYI